MIAALYQDVDAPSLDLGAQARLRRLDPRLCVTFSQYAIDPLSSRPIECDPEAGGGPILEPAWNLWIRNPERGWIHIRSYAHFGHKEIADLEADLGRFFSPGEILAKLAERRESIRVRQRESYAQDRRDMARANKKRISDLVFEGKSGYRTRKPISFPGQTNRSTPTERFLPPPHEDGWTMPERRKPA